MSDPSMNKSISKNSIILAAFALCTAALIAFTQATTKKNIEANKQKAVEKALTQLVPSSDFDNAILDSAVLLEKGELSNKKERQAYFAFKENRPYAAVLPATAPDGYGGAIQLIVGIYTNGEIAGVRVVPPHNETPGLGDAIEIKKSDWILSFNGKSLNNPTENLWKVKKDNGYFDQMTGATITPRAVVKAVHNSLIYFDENNHELFNKGQNALNKQSQLEPEAD